MKSSSEDFLWDDLPETVVYEKPLPDGIPQPPEGFVFVTEGELPSPSVNSTSDIVWFSGNEWSTDFDWRGKGEGPWAIRIGSEVAKANGIHA